MFSGKTHPPEHLTTSSSSYSSSSRAASPNGRFDHTAPPTSLVPQGGFAYQAHEANQYKSLPVTSTHIKNNQYTTLSVPLSGPKQTGLSVQLKHIRSIVTGINTLAVQPTEDPQNQSWEQQASVITNSRRTIPKTHRRIHKPSSTATNSATAQSSSSNSPVNSINGPKYPKYTAKSSRLDSFKGCQSIAVSTIVLSEAGFFYAGIEDCTRCFYCGIGLRHWSKNDDPWTEHARFSLGCDHVVSVKGREFVNLVKLALELTTEKTTGAGKTSDTFASPTNNGANAITGMDLMQEILTIEEERDCFDETPLDRQNMAAELSRVNQHLRGKALCSYCKRLEVSLVFLPCGHLVSCNTCGNRQRSCVTCGSNVKGTVRMYNA